MGRRQFETVQKKRRDEWTGIGNDRVVQRIEKAIQKVFEEAIQKRSGWLGLGNGGVGEKTGETE